MSEKLDYRSFLTGLLIGVFLAQGLLWSNSQDPLFQTLGIVMHVIGVVAATISYGGK